MRVTLSHYLACIAISRGIEHHRMAEAKGQTNHPIGKRDPIDHHIDGKAGELAHFVLTGAPPRTGTTPDGGWDVIVNGRWLIDIKTRWYTGPGALKLMVPIRQMRKYPDTHGYALFNRLGDKEMRETIDDGDSYEFEWGGYISKKRLVLEGDLVPKSRYGEECYAISVGYLTLELPGRVD